MASSQTLSTSMRGAIAGDWRQNRLVQERIKKGTPEEAALKSWIAYIAKLTPAGYQEIDRAKILEPTQAVGGRDIVWVHPAFSGKCMFIRNDQEIVCVSLAAE